MVSSAPKARRELKYLFCTKCKKDSLGGTPSHPNTLQSCTHLEDKTIIRQEQAGKNY